MPDSNERIPHIHGAFSPVDFSSWEEDDPNKAPVIDEKREKQERALKAMRSRNFTPEDYVNLMSGRYHEQDNSFRDEDLNKLADLLSKHKHNNPQNNDRVIDNILEDMGKKKDSFWEKYKLKAALNRLPISPEKLHDVISNYETIGKDNLQDLHENPAFNREHLAALVNKPTVALSQDMVKHPAMDKQLFDKMMSNRKYDTAKLPSGVYNSPHFSAEHAKEVLSNPKNKIGEHEFDNYLEKLAPESRHKYLDDALGITGGKPEREKDEFDDEDDYGWENWSPGEQHLPRMAQQAASSKFLTPAQIDHIKRHGDFDQKWALFNNDNIDPKHAIEMLSKWDEDDHRHGYNEDDLKQHLRDENEDNLWDDYREEAEEKVREDYPMSEYLKNFSNDELAQAYFDQDYSDWRHNWIMQNKGYDLVANPDFDANAPESEDNPKQVKVSDLSSGDFDDIIDDYDDQAEAAFQDAMDQAPQTPDSIYEGYDEANNDDTYREMNRMFDDELDNWSSSEKFLPKHVYSAVQEPWTDENNITPEQLKAGLDHPLKLVREAAASNESLPPELISQVLNGDYDDDMKKAVLGNAKNIQPEHITQALESGDEDLARRAIKNIKATPEHISQAIQKYPDSDSIVDAALSHHGATDAHAQQVINNAVEKGDYVGGLHTALGSKFNVSPESLAQVMEKVPNSQVKESAVRHPNATPEIIQSALNNDNQALRRAALHVQTRRFPPTSSPVDVKLGTHPLRQLRDFIDQNGGSMSKSKMKSMGVNPAPIDKLFKPNGTIESKDIQNFIDQMPATNYNTSHSAWNGGQRHSDENQNVFQLNYTQDQVNQMEKAGVLPTFQKIHEATFRSGHPVNLNTLGWVRYTGSPEQGFHIDEVQTDFGQSMIQKVAAQAKEALRTGAISEEQAEDAMERAKDYYPEEHVKKITEILFGNKHPSEILHEAFKQYMRQKGFGNTPVHIWQPQSKAPISGQTTQTTIRAGDTKDILERAKKGNIDNDARALIGWGQKAKIVPASFKEIKPEHLDALGAAYEAHVNERAANPAALPPGETAEPKLPVPLPVHMQEGYGNIPKKMKYQEGQYGELPTQNNPGHKGSPTYKDVIRKSEVDAATRNKIALTLKAVKDRGQAWEQLKQMNPNAYQALMELVQSLVDLFKKKSGEDPQALVHELEIQQQLEEQQMQQEQQQGGQPQEGGQPSQPGKDEPVHRRQMVYAPGSERRYSSQDARIKDQEGNWNAFGGGLQDPNEGQNG